MNYIYSPTFNCFYNPIDLLEKEENFRKNGTYPDDGIEVSEELFVQFACTTPPEGKMRMPGKDGLPYWGDVPPPTDEEKTTQAEDIKRRSIETAFQSVSLIQLKLQAGRKITAAETTKLNNVLDYIEALELIDTSSPDTIVWPEKPAS